MDRQSKISLAAMIAAGGLCVSAGCSKDPNYNVDNLNNIDGSINVFSDSLSFPIGRTDSITLANALDLVESEALDSLLVKDIKGNYSISTCGDYNLDEVISELHLEELRNINGASCSTKVEYKIGDIDPKQFKIEGKQFSYESEAFSDFNLDDIPIPSISAPDQVINAGMYKYLPSDLDVGKKVGNVEYSEDLIDIKELKTELDKFPIPIPGDTEVSVQSILDGMGKAKFSISYQKDVSEKFSLGENAGQIADIFNFKLKSGGKLKVEIKSENCPITDGQMVPDLNLDISSMFILADANPITQKLNLKDLVLNKANGYSVSRDFSVTGLASGFPYFEKGELLAKGLANLDGSLYIKDAKTTPNKINSLASKMMKLKAVISFNGLILDEMDIKLGTGVAYSVPDVEIPVNINYELPEAVTSVNKVYFDPNKKLELSISATNLSNLVSSDGSSHISVIPDIEITFPEGLEVEGAVNNKVVVKQEDLFAGPIDKMFTIVSIKPTNSGRWLSFSGKVTAKVKADASGTFSSKYLPTSAANDVVITAKIKCEPALKDYDVTLNKDKVKVDVSESQEFTFELKGLEDFGTFKVGLKGSPVATVKFNLPSSSETDMAAENLVIAIPKMIVVDGSGISGFDSGNNTITINGNIPETLNIPISYLEVTPEAGVEGTKVCKGVFSVTGRISLSNTDITRITFDELKGKKARLDAVIPTMEASSITLDGDFSKSLDYEAKDIVILDEETLRSIPKEVKSISQVDLDNVNALFEIRVSGLPDLSSNFSLRDTKIQLPDFMVGENDSNVLVLDDDIAIKNGQAVFQVAKLCKIRNVQIEGVKEIKGDVKLFSSLYAQRPTVDVSTLKGTISAEIKIGVGNGADASHPGKISIEKADVKVGYDIHERVSLTLGEVPPELQAENVNLGLNPQLHLELSTNFGAPVSGDFVLTPFIGGQMQESVTIKGIELPYSDDCTKTKVNKYAIGSNVAAERDEILIATDLSPLIRRIPDSIVVSINVGIEAGKDCVIYPAADYSCDMKYDFSIPVSFSKDFAFAMSSDIALDEGINDYLKLADDVTIRGHYLSTLPVGVDCELLLLDPNDKVIELKRKSTLKIHPSANGKWPSSEDFAVSVAIADPKNVNARKLRLKFSALASADVNLNADQFLQITDLNGLVLGGYKIDANE